MTERILAGLTLALCAVLFARLFMGVPRRARFDAALHRAWRSTRRSALHLWHWRSTRRASRQAAEEAIRRAQGGSWDGNVYRPKSFRKPPADRKPPRDKMH